MSAPIGPVRRLANAAPLMLLGTIEELRGSASKSSLSQGLEAVACFLRVKDLMVPASA
jgi:hypothetical protein